MDTYDYDLTPLSIGFDPRRHDDMDVEIAVRPRLTVAYGDDGRVITGTPTIIGSVLTRAGYRLRWTWPTLEGYLAEIITAQDGGPVLEMRDPNDGSEARYQYLVMPGGIVASRRLPATGDIWRGAATAPWWEPVRDLARLPSPSILRDWRDACESDPMEPWAYAHTTDHVVAWTPNGREARWAAGGGVELQPPLDNWWHRCADLEAAHHWWYTQAGAV